MTIQKLVFIAMISGLSVAPALQAAEQISLNYEKIKTAYEAPKSQAASSDASVTPVDALLVINHARSKPAPATTNRQDLKRQSTLDPSKPQAISDGLDRDIIRRIPRKPKSGA